MPILVKLTDGSEHSIEVDDFTLTVFQFKQECEKVISFPAMEQRVVFRGKILKDAETLQSCGVQNESTVHVVRSKAQTASSPQTTSTAPQLSSAPPPPASQPIETQEVNPYASFPASYNNFSFPTGMQNPAGAPVSRTGVTAELLSQMTRSPEMMRLMRQMNPMLANVPDEALQQYFETLSQNPQILESIMQMQTGMGGGNNSPMGNFDAVRQPFVPSVGATAPVAGAPPSFPPSSLGGMENMGFNFPASAFPPSAPRGDPRVIYRQQLQEIKDMGFPNEEAILIALEQTQGNVSFAVDRLLNTP